jgi:hypothetical protein
MFVLGQTYVRRDLQRHFGGQAQAGISTPTNQPFILLFTGEQGEQYGYRDGWTKDGVFLYTSEGQVGDMVLVLSTIASATIEKGILEENHWEQPLSVLRARAIASSTTAKDPVERKQAVRYRSEAIRVYVLKRSDGYVRVVVSKHHSLPSKVDPTWNLTTFVVYPTGGLTIPNGLRGFVRTAVDGLIVALIKKNLTEKLPKRYREKKNG